MDAPTTNIPVEFVPTPMGSAPQRRKVRHPNKAKAVTPAVIETPIQREWRLWHTVIPASSDDQKRLRTPYFYRQQAISWARNARRYGWYASGQFRETAVGLAKSYLKIYREMKGASR